MSLTIEITKYKGHAVSRPSSVVFDRDGGGIGRSDDNRLVLPEDSVSRKHALIIYENGRYYLMDNSANGTLIYNRDLLVQHEKAELASGDILQIGDYELSVRLSSFEGDAGLFPPPEETDSGSGLMGDAPGEASPDEAGRAGREDRGLFPKELSIDDLFKDQTEQPGSLWREDKPVLQAPTPSRGGKSAASEESGFTDFFKKLDIESVPAASEKEPEARSDAPAPKAAEKAPAPSTEPGFTDFFKKLDMEPSPAVSEQKLEGSGISAPAPAPEREDETVTQARAFEVLESVPARAPPADKKPAIFDSGAQPAPLPASAPLRQEKARPLEPPLADTGSAAELFELFLKGAGIENPGVVKIEEMREIVESLGALFRELVFGLWTVLRGRSELKAEIRLQMTMVRQAGNNPLKFSPTLEDALNALLKRTQLSFLGPVEAVREGFQDVMNHQLAMHAGIQASLMEALEMFDPQHFAEKAKNGFAFKKESKCWRTYCDSYGDLKEAAAEGIFGKAFVRAYEEQLAKLRSRRPN